MSFEEIVEHILREFDKEPTAAILVFELVVVVATVAALRLLARDTPRILTHYGVLAIGVLIFEIFTAPMWNNFKLGWWAYVYKDVSWVLTLEWTTLILATVLVVDRLFASWTEWQRFLLYLAVLTAVALPAEVLIVGLGIRSYAPEVLDVLAGSYIPGLGVSIHQIYYLPVFLSLAISLYKYWLPSMRGEPRLPTTANWPLRFALAFIGVFFFEIMVEPMVVNANFPSWSYIYRDISVVMTLFWIVLIWLGTAVVDGLMPRVDRGKRFVAYLVTIAVVAAPIEAWLINNGYRIYGPSATANFSGFKTIISGLPVEVALGIPLYLALVIAFIRYWSRVFEQPRTALTVAEAVA